MKRIMTIGVIIVVLFQSNMLFADSDWTKGDTIMELTWQVINVIDYGQTMEISNNPDKWVEYNPILGEHPTNGEVNTYFIAGALLHVGIAYVIPKRWRPWFECITITSSSTCVVNNFSAGIKMRW